jgi:transcriptional regulator with XRE-family HTH domain
MDFDVHGVRGDLIQWTRKQQGMTMRTVCERGGPCPGYQSEVENLRKSEVGSKLLASWVTVLGVTQAFVRGEVPVYHIAPEDCRGLAADILSRVIEDGTCWVEVTVAKRASRILCLIADHSRQLPRVVLAYTLGVQLTTLDAMMLGQHPIISKAIMQALADLTTLPQPFFAYGILPEPDGDQPSPPSTWHG